MNINKIHKFVVMSQSLQNLKTLRAELALYEELVTLKRKEIEMHPGLIEEAKLARNQTLAEYKHAIYYKLPPLLYEFWVARSPTPLLDFYIDHIHHPKSPSNMAGTGEGPWTETRLYVKFEDKDLLQLESTRVFGRPEPFTCSLYCKGCDCCKGAALKNSSPPLLYCDGTWHGKREISPKNYKTVSEFWNAILKLYNGKIKEAVVAFIKWTWEDCRDFTFAAQLSDKYHLQFDMNSLLTT